MLTLYLSDLIVNPLGPYVDELFKEVEALEDVKENETDVKSILKKTIKNIAQNYDNEVKGLESELKNIYDTRTFARCIRKFNKLFPDNNVISNVMQYSNELLANDGKMS